MLRLTDVQLPLDHPEEDLAAAIVARLGIVADDLIRYTIFRRGYDARKKSAITLVYTLDVEIRNEAQAQKRLAGNRHVSATPDTGYRFVAEAPANLNQR